CYELHQPPLLGSLVKTRDGEVEIYGVVRQATTAPIEPGRLPLARGQEMEKEEDIFLSHPQLSLLLRTQFVALVVGHSQGQGVLHHLPPRPARIHSFVSTCAEAEVTVFSQSLDFLSLLLNPLLPGGDEVIIACLNQMAQVRDDKHGFLLQAGRELARFLVGQSSRFQVMLRGLDAGG
ncbi:MAG: hypothetical protein AAB037_00835, partial [Chloroflexota bacterium]